MKQLHVRYILLSWTLSVVMYQITILINKKWRVSPCQYFNIIKYAIRLYRYIHIAQHCRENWPCSRKWSAVTLQRKVLMNLYMHIYIYMCVCIHMSTDWGRGGLWWPASSWYWLSHTGCRQCFLCTKWLMCGKTYIYPPKMFSSTDLLFENGLDTLLGTSVVSHIHTKIRIASKSVSG